MKKMEEYCSTVEKLLEATAAMSLAVENKKLAPQTTTPASSEKTTHANKITNKQPTFSESSLEDSTRNKPPTRDRRKSYSQGQNSSLDSKSANSSNNQTPNNDIGTYSKSSQDGNKILPNQLSNNKSAVDRRYSIASSHIAIANHISSSSQGLNDLETQFNI